MKILPKILILMMCMVPLGADELPTITLDEAIAAAAENNLDLQKAGIALNQAIRKQNSVMTTYMPTFGISGSASTGASFPGSMTTDPETHLPMERTTTAFNGINFSAGANASFTFSGNMITDAESRALQKETASITYRSEYNSTVLGIISDYWNLAADDLDVETQRLALEDAEASYNSAKEMYESGMTTELVFSQAEQQYEAQKLNLMTAENTKAIDMIAFRAATGIETDFRTEELPETVYLSLPSAEELFNEYSGSSIAIQTYTNLLNIRKNAESTYKMTQYVPTLTATVNYNYAGGFDDSWKYSNSSHGLTGSVSVNIPISSYIPGSSADVNRKDAADETRKAALDLENTKNSYLQGLETMKTTLEQLQNSIKMYERMRDLSKKTYDLAQESFDAGLMSADDLSSARNDYLTAEMNLTNLRVTHLTTSANFADTLGITLEELQEKYAIPSAFEAFMPE